MLEVELQTFAKISIVGLALKKKRGVKDAFGIIDGSPIPGDHDLLSKFTDNTVSSQENLKSNWGNLRPYTFDVILYRLLKLFLGAKITTMTV